MIDLYQQHMSDGLRTFKTKAKTTNNSKKFNTSIDYFVNKYVDELQLNEEDALLSIKLNRQRLRQELKNTVKSTELKSHIQLAFNVIFNDGIVLIEKEPFELLKGEFLKAKYVLNNLNLREYLPDNLNDILKISPACLDMIYQMALKKFSDLNYNECLALYILLTVLNQNNPDYWYRLGISAQKCEMIDLALRAYRNTIALFPTLVGARLFAIECYIASGALDEARAECANVKHFLKSNAIDEIWPQFFLSLESLLTKT